MKLCEVDLTLMSRQRLEADHGVRRRRWPRHSHVFLELRVYGDLARRRNVSRHTETGLTIAQQQPATPMTPIPPAIESGPFYAVGFRLSRSKLSSTVRCSRIT